MPLDNKIPNPNIEIRNKPKRVNSKHETCPEPCRRIRNKPQPNKSKSLRNSKTANPNQGCLEHSGVFFWSFEFVSNFGFRASNFLSLAPLRLCASHLFPKPANL